MLDLAVVRSNFPAIAESDYIFGDNAGGSQCLSTVVARISDYLLHTNVQLGADYSVSVTSTNRVAQGAEAARELFNAASVDEIAYGASSTMLVENLARALESTVQPGDEFIVTGEHEANAGPWKKLAARKGLTVKFWHARAPSNSENPYAVLLQIDDLLPLITSRTRVVAFTACSNILGSVVPVKEVVAAVRAKAKEVGAANIETCVDCVAYAPHRRIDVQDWDVDYAVFSMYKVYGPHTSVLYARAASLKALGPVVHHFLKVDDKPHKLQPGGPGYELVYSCTAVPIYLRTLSPSQDLKESFAMIAEHEQTLVKPLLTYLKSKFSRGVRIVGQEETNLTRVPTISFVVVGDRAIASKDVVKYFDQKGNIGVRYGHFYAYTLVDTLQPKLDSDDAVVRISLVHYNTVKEVDTIISILEEVLA